MSDILSHDNVTAKLEEEIKQLKLANKEWLASSKHQSKYEESQLRFKTVFESSRLGNKILDSDLNILEVNQAMVSLLGYDSKEDLIGSPILKFVPEDCQENWRKLQKKLWEKTSPSFSLETCLVKKNGEVVWCQVTSILFQDSGTTLGYTIIEDITEQRNLRLHKEEFISVASHELKTPLTSLKAGLQLISAKIRKGDIITENIVKIFKAVEVSATKLNYLFEDLLNTSKIEQGELVLNEVKFNAFELAENCCSHLRLVGEFKIKYDIDRSVELFADEQKINQVLVNLVNNAVKYAPESKEILIRIKSSGDTATISVTDYGKGIPKENLDQLFNRYYQVTKNGNHSSGLGLGLYISAEIIRRHKGKIGVDSKLGKGSTFWFTVPLWNNERISN
jgi:PAS domain S-box-containing protein